MSRFRSKVIANTGVVNKTWVGTTKGGSSTTFDTVALTMLYEDQTITDELTPDFTAKRASGEFLPVNPCVISHTKKEFISLGSGTMTLKNQAGASSGTYVLFSGDSVRFQGSQTLQFPSYTADTDIIDKVVIDALAKAKEPDFDVLTFIGELPSTIALFRTQVERLNRIARGVARKAASRERRRARRERRRYDGKRALVDFAGLWLEARYGWRPLVMDIESMMKALAHKASSGLMRKSATQTEEIRAEASLTQTYPDVVYTRTNTRSGTCKYRAVVFYQGDMSPFGFNPLVTAWELTKYSFVVDWIVDIGSWIQALSPRLGYIQKGVSVSTTVKYTDTMQQTAAEGSTHAYAIALAPVTYRDTREIYTRFEYTGIPLPSIQVNLNPLKVMDLIALALQGQKDVATILKL